MVGEYSKFIGMEKKEELYISVYKYNYRKIIKWNVDNTTNNPSSPKLPEGKE